MRSLGIGQGEPHSADECMATPLVLRIVQCTGIPSPLLFVLVLIMLHTDRKLRDCVPSTLAPLQALQDYNPIQFWRRGTWARRKASSSRTW